MAHYTFNTQNHVRIWFSRDPDVFLNDENQLRLVQFRQKNPRAKMTLLYSSSMLNEQAKKKLDLFCHKHHFISLDFDTELLSECIDQIDLDMYKTAKKERDAFIRKQGGNLAAASDIARLITPFLMKGTYSDFDTVIEVESLPDTQNINGPMIFNIGSVKELSFGIPIETKIINNDIIGIAMNNGSIDPSAKDQLRVIQKKILGTYAHGALHTLKHILDIGLASDSILISFAQAGVFNTVFNQFPNIGITDFRFFLEKSTRNIFGSLRFEDFGLFRNKLDNALKIKLKRALQDIYNDDFPEDFTHEDKLKIKKIWANATKELYKDLFSAPFFLVPPDMRNIYNKIKYIDDPDTCYHLIQIPMGGIRSKLLMESVMLFSGPMILSRILIVDAKELWDDIEAELHAYKAMSFDGNKLFNNFRSHQSFPLESSVSMLHGKLSIEQTGKLCDSSWTSHGSKLIQKREVKLHDSARTIQTMWKKHKAITKDKLSPEENALVESGCRQITN